MATPEEASPAPTPADPTPDPDPEDPPIPPRVIGARPPLDLDVGSGDARGVAWIVAHPDDDLLFMNPDILAAIADGIPSTTIVMTAGDAGGAEGYWRQREWGLLAAYAKMAGTAERFVNLTKGEHALHAVALSDRRDVRIVFLRLPDGGFNPTSGGGDGSSRYHGQSLEKLLRSKIDHITAVDDSASYTREELSALLSALLVRLHVSRVGTSEPSKALGFDHSDHHAVAMFTLAAARDADLPSVDAYRGYSLYDSAHHQTSMLPNLTHQEYLEKRAAFLVYCPHDHLACPPTNDYAQWLLRRDARTIALAP